MSLARRPVNIYLSIDSSGAVYAPAGYGPRPAMKEGVDLNRYEPDILAGDLDAIFCGLNPATTAATAGHNFSSRSNRFWTVLYLAGFTDVRLQPHEERRLLDYGRGVGAVPVWIAGSTEGSRVDRTCRSRGRRARPDGGRRHRLAG